MGSDSSLHKVEEEILQQGQFTFRALCVREWCWWSSQTAEELTQGTQADGVCPCGNIPKPYEMEGMVSAGSLPQLSPHRHTWGRCAGSLWCLGIASPVGGQRQGVNCCPEGFVYLHQPAVPQRCSLFLSLRETPVCSVPSWTAWVRRSLCSPGHRCCLTRLSPLWASVCVGRHVWASGGGQQPAANGTYCCIIAGARLSGSLPAVWLKGFVWHFRGSLSYPSCLTLGLWSMSVSIWWVAERQPHEPLLNLPLLLISLEWRWQVDSHSCHFTCPLYPSQGDCASDTRDRKVHFWSGAWGGAVTDSSGPAVYFPLLPTHHFEDPPSPDWAESWGLQVGEWGGGDCTHLVEAGRGWHWGYLQSPVGRALIALSEASGCCIVRRVYKVNWLHSV